MSHCGISAMSVMIRPRHEVFNGLERSGIEAIGHVLVIEFEDLRVLNLPAVITDEVAALVELWPSRELYPALAVFCSRCMAPRRRHVAAAGCCGGAGPAWYL